MCRKHIIIIVIIVIIIIIILQPEIGQAVTTML